MIILGPKTAILGPQFGRIWCWGLIFGGQGGPSWIRPCKLLKQTENSEWKKNDFPLQELLKRISTPGFHSH